MSDPSHYTAQVRHLHDQLAPTLPIEAFVDALEPTELGLQSRDQLYAPVSFTVQISGPISGAAGAIRVQVPVHANPHWLEVMKQRFVDMLGPQGAQMDPDDMDFRTVSGQSIETIGLQDLEALHHVGKLNLFVGDKMMRLPSVPAIPVEYSARKVADIERWLVDTVDEHVPELVARHLAPCKTAHEIDAAIRGDGPLVKSLVQCIQSSNGGRAKWAEFVRTRHVNSPMVLDPKEADLAATTIARDVLLSEVRRFVDAAAPQINAHLKSLESRRLQQEAQNRGANGEFYAPVLGAVSPTGPQGPESTIENSHIFYRDLAQDMLSVPQVRENIIEALYVRPMTSVGCRWHGGKTPAADELGELKDKYKRAERKLKELRARKTPSPAEVAAAEAKAAKARDAYKTAKAKRKAEKGAGGKTSKRTYVLSSSSQPGKARGTIGRRVRSFFDTLTPEQLASVREKVKRPELSTVEVLEQRIAMSQERVGKAGTVGEVLQKRIHSGWRILGKQTYEEALDDFTRVILALVARAEVEDTSLTQEEVVETIRTAFDAFYLKLVREGKNQDEDTSVFLWLSSLAALSILGTDSLAYSKNVGRVGEARDALPQNVAEMREYFALRGAEQIVRLANTPTSRLRDNLLHQRLALARRMKGQSDEQIQALLNALKGGDIQYVENFTFQAPDEDGVAEVLETNDRLIRQRLDADRLKKYANAATGSAKSTWQKLRDWWNSEEESEAVSPSQAPLSPIQSLLEEMKGPGYTANRDDFEGFLFEFREVRGETFLSLEDALQDAFVGSEEQKILMNYVKEKAREHGFPAPKTTQDAIDSIVEYVQNDGTWPTQEDVEVERPKRVIKRVKAKQANEGARIPLADIDSAWAWLTTKTNNPTRADLRAFFDAFYDNAGDAEKDLASSAYLYNDLSSLRASLKIPLDGKKKPDLARVLVAAAYSAPEVVLAHIEAHHPWNAQIHHTIQPMAGAYPAYYNVHHTKQDLSKNAPYAGDLASTYAAYHMFAGVPIAPAVGYTRIGCKAMKEAKKRIINRLHKEQRELDEAGIAPASQERYLQYVRGKGLRNRDFVESQAPPVQLVGCGASDEEDERDARMGSEVAPPVLPLGDELPPLVSLHVGSEVPPPVLPLEDELPPLVSLHVGSEVPPLVPLKSRVVPPFRPTVPLAAAAGDSSDSDDEIFRKLGLPTLNDAIRAKFGK